MLGEKLTKDNMVKMMLQSNTNWKDISTMVHKIMKGKEEIEKERRLKAQALSQASR